MCLLLAAPIPSKRMMGTEETHYGVCFQYDKANHLGKKLLLPGLFDNMLYKLDIQDPQENDCRTCQNEVG